MLIYVIILLLVILLISGILLYPYASCIFLKAKMVSALATEANRLGFRLRRLYTNILYVRNRSSKYDLVVYNADTLYAVKLWSAYHRDTTLVVGGDGQCYHERRARGVFESEDGSDAHSIRSGRFSVFKTHLPQRYAKDREVFYVLLVYPSYEAIVYRYGRGKTKISSGDTLFDKTVYSPSAFIKQMRSLSQDGAEN